MLYAGSNVDRARGGLRGGDLPSAADPVDHPAADARAGAVAEDRAVAEAPCGSFRISVPRFIESTAVRVTKAQRE